MQVDHRFKNRPIVEAGDCLYVNEPWLIDASLWESENPSPEPEECDDNIRVYVPLDINRDAILRRADEIINHFGPASENNEMEYESYFGRLLSQVDLYDEYWSAQYRSGVDKHSPEAITLVRDIVGKLEEIPDECAESFPGCLINELKGEYL